MLPNQLTAAQEKSLMEFASTIDDYDVFITYDITLENGLLDSKTLPYKG